MISAAPALRLAEVSKSYASFQLQDISMELPAGCILGFVGPNGAGKTTTIRIITHLARPDRGRVEVLGRTWEDDAVGIKRRIGYVPESNQLYEQATGQWLGNFLRHYYPTWDDGYFAALLEKFHVPGTKRVKDLSKGNQRKLAVALALAHRPQLLILDEPTSGVDPVVRHSLLRELLEVIQDETRAVLFSTHIVSDLEKVADLVTYILAGRIMLSDEKDILLERWRRLSFRLEDPGRLVEVRKILPYVKVLGREVEGVTSDFRPELVPSLERIAGGKVHCQPLDLEEIMVVLAEEAGE